MSKRQIIKVENLQYSDNLAMRSIYCRCTFLKPLVQEGDHLSVPVAEFVFEEQVGDGAYGLCKGLKRKVSNPTPWDGKEALISYQPRKYAHNYPAGAKVITQGKELSGFELVEGTWADYKSVKIIRPISGIRVSPEQTIRRALVIVDATDGTTMDGGLQLSFATATGCYFRTVDGNIYFETTVIKNSNAFRYRVKSPQFRKLQGSSEITDDRGLYHYISDEHDAHFIPPDILWFKMNKSVRIEGVDNPEDITDEWLELPVEDDAPDDKKEKSILPAVLLVGLSLLGG